MAVVKCLSAVLDYSFCILDFSSFRKIFPELDFGMAEINFTPPTKCLYGAVFSATNLTTSSSDSCEPGFFTM